MTCWYHRLPQRAANEVSLLRATSEAVPKWQGNTLIADEDLLVGRYRFGIRIRFPDDFPNEPPIFTLRYPELPSTVEIHRYLNGELCLLEPEEWSPRMTAASLRARAVAWVHCVVNFMHSGEFVQPTRPRGRR